MTTSWATATLVAATITNGLMAGLFAAYSYAVMPGLGSVVAVCEYLFG